MSGLEETHGDDVRLAPLLKAYWDEMAFRYGEEDGEVPMKALEGRIRWLVVVDDGGEAIGCGAVQPVVETEPGGPADVGEIKRVYVVPSARGAGHSRALMARLVEIAREEGYRALWLDTGTPQHEAVGLYERLGWTRIAPYGQFADDPRTLCYELVL